MCNYRGEWSKETRNTVPEDDVRVGEELKHVPQVARAIAQSMANSVQSPLSCLPMVASSKLLCL